MIQAFKDRRAEQLFNNQTPKGLPADILKKASHLLKQLNAIAQLDDMRVPPGNKLHRLKGTRMGQYAVWINSKWRVAFRWKDGNATEVEITDYHDEK